MAVATLPKKVPLAERSPAENVFKGCLKNYCTLNFFSFHCRSWRSLLEVRTRHVKASLSAKLKGQGIVSQRDLALTQFGFIGFSMLKADKFGIRENYDGDWEAYNHFWRVIGHCIGLEDR